MAAPVKAVSMVFLIFYLAYEIIQRVIKKKITWRLVVIVFLFLSNLVFMLSDIGIKYLGNYILFVIFISPLLLFITKNNTVVSTNRKRTDLNREKIIKRVIELFLIIQIFFSFLGILYRLFLGFSLDTNFGDIVAGTFRIPFMYKADASNMIFVFTMVIVLFIYISCFKNDTNRLIKISSYFTIFFASVNHISLIALLSLLITFKFKKIIYPTFAILLSFLAYSFLQPANLNLIIERIITVSTMFSDLDLISSISLKGQYILGFTNDFKENIFRFIFTGVGAGNYSSRASFFFTGEYISAFNFISISPYMADNSYLLWQELLSAPAHLSGAFHYPYFSIFTFVAELGLVTTLVIFILFVKKIQSFIRINFNHKVFFFVFLFLVGLVDNYYEYFQSTFIMYYLFEKIDSDFT